MGNLSYYLILCSSRNPPLSFDQPETWCWKPSKNSFLNIAIPPNLCNVLQFVTEWHTRILLSDNLHWHFRITVRQTFASQNLIISYANSIQTLARSVIVVKQPLVEKEPLVPVPEGLLYRKSNRYKRFGTKAPPSLVPVRYKPVLKGPPRGLPGRSAG
jgi:hypothetical protein